MAIVGGAVHWCGSCGSVPRALEHDGAKRFVGGTASNAGKSWTGATAIYAVPGCGGERRRRLRRSKAQNMSEPLLPRARDGGEIRRAQVAQARGDAGWILRAADEPDLC